MTEVFQDLMAYIDQLEVTYGAIGAWVIVGPFAFGALLSIAFFVEAMVKITFYPSAYVFGLMFTDEKKVNAQIWPALISFGKSLGIGLAIMTLVAVAWNITQRFL